MIKWIIKVSGSLWYKRICHKGVFFILDAPFALIAAYRDTKKQMNLLSFLKRKLLMSVRENMGITQFHCIYLCESCIKYGILKS